METVNRCNKERHARHGTESGSESGLWASQLFRAEQNISSSSERLEQAFKDFDTNLPRADEESRVPTPIKIIRRLTALEIAIGQLRLDCERISRKRNKSVNSVIADQSTIVTQTKKMIQISSLPNSLSECDEWNELSRELTAQTKILCSSITAHRS